MFLWNLQQSNWCLVQMEDQVLCQYFSEFDGLTVSGNHFRRVRDVDLKRDYAFVEYSNPRDADDAKYHLDGRDVDGRRITVEFAKGLPRGPGGIRESAGRGPTPGSGRCFNCGFDGHWARDCTAGDWKNKCYHCGDGGHIERNCQNSPKKPCRSRSPHKRGRDVVYDERRLTSPIGISPEPKRRASPSKSRKHGTTPIRDIPRERGSRSPRKEEDETSQDDHRDCPRESPSPRRGGREREEDGYSDSPKETSGSPLSPATTRYEAVHGNNRSPSPITRDDGSPVNDYDDDDAHRSPRGSRPP